MIGLAAVSSVVNNLLMVACLLKWLVAWHGGSELSTLWLAAVYVFGRAAWSDVVVIVEFLGSRHE